VVQITPPVSRRGTDLLLKVEDFAHARRCVEHHMTGSIVVHALLRGVSDPAPAGALLLLIPYTFTSVYNHRMFNHLHFLIGSSLLMVIPNHVATLRF
jgi:hypothetical protein